jgi:hypothetical protein
VDGDDVEADKAELIKFNFFVDPKNPAFRHSKEFTIFKNGKPEDRITWLMEYRDIETVFPFKAPLEKTKILRALLKGRALFQFEYNLRNRLGAEDVALPDCNLLEIVAR